MVSLIYWRGVLTLRSLQLLKLQLLQLSLIGQFPTMGGLEFLAL